MNKTNKPNKPNKLKLTYDASWETNYLTAQSYWDLIQDNTNGWSLFGDVQGEIIAAFPKVPVGQVVNVITKASIE